MGTGQSTELNAEREVRTSSASLVEFAITGMTCANCARHVTEAIQSVPGVGSATVRLEANRASVRWSCRRGAEDPCE